MERLRLVVPVLAEERCGIRRGVHTGPVAEWQRLWAAYIFFIIRSVGVNRVMGYLYKTSHDPQMSLLFFQPR